MLMNVSPLHPDIFVLTTLEVTISDHCSRLMDASLALLSTVRAMEMQLARQKQTPPLQQGCDFLTCYELTAGSNFWLSRMGRQNLAFET